MKKQNDQASRPIIEGRMSEYIHKKSRRTLLRLLQNFGHHPGLTGLAITLATLGGIVQISKPFILKLIIDENLSKGSGDLRSIGVYAILYLVVVIVGIFSDYFQAITLGTLGQRIMHRLRTGLFSHIQRMNMSFFDKNSSGSLLTRINSDIESLSDLFSSMVVQFVKDIIIIIQIMAAMMLLDMKIALYCFITIPIIAIITFIYRTLARKNFIRMKAQISKLNSFLAENITGMKMVQIYCREKVKNDEYHKLGRDYYKFSMTEILLNSLSHPLLNALANLSIAVLISIFSPLVIRNTVLVGTLFAFTQYIRQFFNPIANLAEQFTAIQSSLISADRIYDILDQTETLEDLDIGTPLQTFSGHIVFENVWFAYNEENWILKDVSFEILPGQSVAFVGSTGSGKTTIISLLARFYEIQKGRILLDGTDISEYNLTDLRRKISVVQQDVFLFTGDIKYNVRLNDDSISDLDIKKAIDTVSATKFVESLPDKYEAHVSERGAEFSAGQRQLIAFARAIAAQPSVLVLDEATASIDTETELALSSAMQNVSKDHTTITIAHRLSTIVNSDTIYLLDHGVIAEQGTHSDLISKGGAYSELYALSQINNSQGIS